jgi:hypothetical protein
MTAFLIRRTGGYMGTETEEGNCKPRNAKDCQQPPEVRQSREKLLL